MSTASAALFHQLIDDASTFPPGDLPLATAFTAHQRHCQGPRAPFLGRLVCRASALPALSELSKPTEPTEPTNTAQPLRLRLVLDTGTAGLAEALKLAGGAPGLTVDAVELALPAGAGQPAAAHRALRELAAVATDLTCYLELDRTADWRPALPVLAAANAETGLTAAAKLRTGGLAAAAFPTEAEVAAFVHACHQHHTAFKCTAGLHHAVRHTDRLTGFEHHGFLNVLLAAAAAQAGADLPELTALLALRDGTAVADRVRSLGRSGGTAEATGARGLFHAFGSCEFDEPVDDLVQLGLLDQG